MSLISRVFGLFAIAALYQHASGVPQATIAQDSGVLVTPLPDLNAPAPAPASASASDTCGSCYIIADVAALVWYSEAFINTAATAYVGVQTGNGTRVTRTSIIQNEGPFTYDPYRISSAGMQDLVLTPVNYGPTATLSGVTLTSPTAYNVFSAYSVTSAQLVNGVCVTTSGSRETVSPAYSEILPSANGQVSLDAAGQQQFINYIGFTTCSGRGEHAVGSALIPVLQVTSSVTTTFSHVPLAAQTTLSLAPTTNPTSTARPGSIVTLTEIYSSTTVTATLTGTAVPAGSASAPEIVVGSTTITPTAKPLSLPVFNASASGSLFSGTITGNTTVIGSTQIIVPGTGIGTGTAFGTGLGGGNSTGIIPFISEASVRSNGILGMFVAAVLVAAIIL